MKNKDLVINIKLNVDKDEKNKEKGPLLMSVQLPKTNNQSVNLSDIGLKSFSSNSNANVDDSKSITSNGLKKSKKATSVIKTNDTLITENHNNEKR